MSFLIDKLISKFEVTVDEYKMAMYYYLSRIELWSYYVLR